MDKQEVFRRDTLSQTFEHLEEVLMTIMIDEEFREIIIVPMRQSGVVVGYETTIRWIDKQSTPYIR